MRLHISSGTIPGGPLLILSSFLLAASCSHCASVTPSDAGHDFLVDDEKGLVDGVSMWSYPDLVLRWELTRIPKGPLEGLEGPLDYGVTPRDFSQVHPSEDAPPEPLEEGQILIMEIHHAPTMWFGGCSENKLFWFRKSSAGFEKSSDRPGSLPRWESTEARARDLREVEEEILGQRSEFLRLAQSPTASPAQKVTIAALLDEAGETNPTKAYRELRTRHELYGGFGGPEVRMYRRFDLKLFGRELTDIGALRDFRNLRTLGLDGNRIKDLSPLSGLTRLSELHLSGNLIDDGSPLVALRELTQLDLSRNAVREISFVSPLTQLKNLNLADNHIQDLSPLSELKRLEWLFLQGNEIKDLRSLRTLPQLVSLNVNRNGITDVSPLSGLWESLHYLYADSNKITDVAPLESLRYIIILDLRNNQIRDARPLKRFFQPNVALDGNPIEQGPM
jgi:hypothetical protein